MELSESISDDARAYGVDGVSYSYVYKMNKVCLTLGKGKAKEESENFGEDNGIAGIYNDII